MHGKNLASGFSYHWGMTGKWRPMHRRGRSRATALGLLAVAAAASTAFAAIQREEPMSRAEHVAEAPHAASGPEVRLPEAVEPFRRSAETRTIAPAGIFEYMDGAGELYLAYRFDRLDVTEYASHDHGDILVELYWMRDADDAYGLLSQDWGGEHIALGGRSPSTPARALYGGGLLRIWSEDLYARVMATQEGGAAKEAVLTIGHAIVAGRSDPPIPRLVAALPERPVAGYLLAPESVCFLRSHLVLNSLYFLSQRDILDLGPRTEAVLASYRGRAEGKGGPRPRLLLVRYPDAVAAQRALARFLTAYLPELPGKGAAPAVGAAHVEDGWVGFSTSGRGLVLVFEAPDREVAESFAAATRTVLASLEGRDE